MDESKQVKLPTPISFANGHGWERQEGAPFMLTVEVRAFAAAKETELAAMTAERDNWCAIAGRLEIERDGALDRAVIAETGGISYGEWRSVCNRAETAEAQLARLREAGAALERNEELREYIRLTTLSNPLRKLRRELHAALANATDEVKG